MKNLTSLKLLFAVVVLFMLSFGTQAYAQIRYTETDTIDGVTVMHRWQRSHLFKRDSRTILNLRLINNNDYPVEIKLAVGFYQSGVIAYSSEEHAKCFEPGESKRGGKAGLRFKSEELTIEDIESDNFDWDFIRLDVKETDECP